MRLLPLTRWGALAGLLLAALPQAQALTDLEEIQEPQAFRLQINSVYTGIRIDADHETIKNVGSTSTETYDHLVLSPVIGLDAVGSVYHPNLLQFSIGGELLPSYDLEKTNSSTNSTSRKAINLLGNYTANFAFLSQKPYRFNLFVNQNYGYREYDFYNHAEVSSLRYGGNFGYDAGPVPFSLSIWRLSEQTYGELSDISIEETGLNFNARNKRKWGSTSLNYGLTQSDRGSFYGGQSTNDNEQFFNIADVEAITFGRQNQFHFGTDTGYTWRQSTLNPSQDFHAATDLAIQHTPTLSSSYDLGYYRTSSSASVGSDTSDNISGNIAFRHQLYKSLVSTLHFEGMDLSTSSNFPDANGATQASTSTEKRFGGGVDELYTKNLGSVGVLSMGANFLLEHSSIDNGGADMLVIVGESHNFSSNSSGTGIDTFFLNSPYVDESSIVIKDGSNSVLIYERGIDYTVSTQGSLTQIRRVSSGSIKQAQTILVDYRSHMTNAGEYDTFTEALSMRIDLWKGLLAVYGRYNSMQNSNSGQNSSPANNTLNFVLANTEGYTFGAETNWRKLRLGAEYENRVSTFSTYNTVRLFQSFSFKPDRFSTVNFDFLQSHIQYTDTDRTEQDYSFMTGYSRSMGRYLGVHLDAGVDLRRGQDVDETRVGIRPGFEFTAGRLQIRFGYTYEYLKYLNSTEHTKNMLFLSGRRDF